MKRSLLSIVIILDNMNMNYESHETIACNITNRKLGFTDGLRV